MIRRSFSHLIVIFISVFICCSFAQFKKANREWKFESCDLSNGDDCAQRLYIFGYRQLNDKSSARNEKEMKEYCSETREAEKCMKDWGKNCLASFEKQCLNLLLSGAATSRRLLCTSKGQQRFLQNRDCFIKTVNTQHDCMDQFKKDMSKIVTIDRNKYGLKLRCGCCFADKWLKCFRQSAKKVCNEEGIKFLEWVVDPYVSDALDLGCKKDWTYGAGVCTQSIKQIPTSPRNVTIPVSKSIMLPLYLLLSEFAREQDVKDLSSLELPE